jgi:hypothetical protein
VAVSTAWLVGRAGSESVPTSVFKGTDSPNSLAADAPCDSATVTAVCDGLEGETGFGKACVVQKIQCPLISVVQHELTL